LRHDNIAHRDGRRTIEPIALNQQLDILLGTCIHKRSHHLAAPDAELALDFEERLAGGGLGVEGFVEGEEACAETEEGAPGGVGEFFAVGDREGLAAALDYFVVVFVDDVECVA